MKTRGANLGVRYIAPAMWTAIVFACSASSAVELHSNGLGGGDWSDPLSWREKVAPTAADDVVISRGDIIAFDRNDDGKTSCNQMFIDPNGSFVFKTGAGRIVCSVAGQIEAFGVILLDGTRSAADKFELRMVGTGPTERTLTLMKGGKLTINGRRNLAHGKHNVVVSSAFDPATKKPPIEATIAAKDGSSIDAQRAEFVHVNVMANDIDNTGAEAGERVNIVGNHFVGIAHMTITSCDSPLIADNLMEFSDAPSTPHSAIFINGCLLAEIRGNKFRGRYAFGIQARSMTDSTLTDCDFEGQATGVYWYGVNGMLKDLAIRKCDTGLTCTSMSGVVENTLIEGCLTGYYHAVATAQFTNVRILDVPAKGTVMSYYGGPLRLLNCNVDPAQIVIATSAPKKVKDGVLPIECLNYVVVKASGKVPFGSRVEVATADRGAALKTNNTSRAADPNVRNSPAPLGSNGLTPLPDSLEPLIVRGWSFDDELKLVAAPSYLVRIMPPVSDPAADDAAKPLASQTTVPDQSWYREEPNMPIPTVEVNVP